VAITEYARHVVIGSRVRTGMIPNMTRPSMALDHPFGQLAEECPLVDDLRKTCSGELSWPSHDLQSGPRRLVDWSSSVPSALLVDNGLTRVCTYATRGSAGRHQAGRQPRPALCASWFFSLGPLAARFVASQSPQKRRCDVPLVSRVGCTYKKPGQIQFPVLVEYWMERKRALATSCFGQDIGG
jgi:hypothetical protein